MGSVYRFARGRPRNEEGPEPIWQSAGAMRKKNGHPDSASAGSGSQLAQLQARFAAAGLALDPLSEGTLLAQYCGMHRVLRSAGEALEFVQMFERRTLGRCAR